MHPDDLQLSTCPLGSLPFIRHVIDHLGITEVIDELLPMDPRATASHADSVVVMLVSALGGRAALYDISEWLSQTDCEVLLGEGRESASFHDTRLGGTLDQLYEVGTDTILSLVVQRYLGRQEEPQSYTVHADTTSVSVVGVGYDEDGAPMPMHGFSKDHRPDLMQLVFGMTLHGSVGIPLTYRLMDGNADDHTFNRLNLDELSKLLPDRDEVTVVADAKFVDAETLGQARRQGMHYVSLVPRTFKLRAELVDEAHAKEAEYVELSRAPGDRQSAPDRVYSGMSFQRPFAVQEEDGRVVKRPHRFLVVHSAQLEAKFDKSLDDKMRKEVAKLDKRVSQASKRGFACEEDAQTEADKLAAGLSCYEAFIAVEAEVVQEKRRRRGRPRKDEEPPPTHTVYRLYLEDMRPDPERIAMARRHASHFVLVTDHLDSESWPDERILTEYRHQHIIEGHTGFRWLKGVAQVAPVFLKTPERIAALGLVLVLALMVRNYIQFKLRASLRREHRTILGLKKKPVQNPTTETALKRFGGVLVHRIVWEGEVRRRVQGLNDDCQTILELFGLDEAVFCSPYKRRVRKKMGGRDPTP